MTTTHTMSLQPAYSRFDRGTARKARANRPLIIAVALFLAVLIADVVLIAKAAPSIADIGSLYITST